MKPPRPRPWYRPAVRWEWGSPWWGLKKWEEQTVIPGLLPARTLFLGPITLIWMGPMAPSEPPSRGRSDRS